MDAQLQRNTSSNGLTELRENPPPSPPSNHIYRDRIERTSAGMRLRVQRHERLLDVVGVLRFVISHVRAHEYTVF